MNNGIITIINIIRRLIQSWFAYASTYFNSAKVFTINMHYFNHVPRALQMFGPTRLISARPLERMIGKLKRNIRSKKSPADNSYNSVLNHFADSYKKIPKTNENFRNTTNIEYKSSQYKH